MSTMKIIRAPGFEFLFIVCTNPEDAYIVKQSDNSFASIQEVHDIMEVCQGYLKIFTQEKIDEINQQSLPADDCEQMQQPSVLENVDNGSRKGNVYLILNERNRYTKIGFTSRNPKYRERTLQSEEPEVRLIASFRGSMDDEARLHDLFQHKRLRGEWFDLTEEDINVIKNYFTSKVNN